VLRRKPRQPFPNKKLGDFADAYRSIEGRRKMTIALRG
jgi:hypothetical protein